jgi:hypothetical protein
LDAFVNSYEYRVLTWLDTSVRSSTAPSDYVLCFPYCPGINFITGRPTFQRRPYVDDEILRAQPSWIREMREQIETRPPKVIIVWNWAINGTEISRFRNWARPLYRYIASTYKLRGESMGFEVYVR